MYPQQNKWFTFVKVYLLLLYANIHNMIVGFSFSLNINYSPTVLPLHVHDYKAFSLSSLLNFIFYNLHTQTNGLDIHAAKTSGGLGC